MSNKTPIYLIMRQIALFNDEFYDDLSLNYDVANPVSLFTTKEEALAEVRRITRKAIAGMEFWELGLGEHGAFLAYEPEDLTPQQAKRLGPKLIEVVKSLMGHGMPTDLRDDELDALIDVLDINLYQVLEEELEPQQIMKAGGILQSETRRPDVGALIDGEETEDGEWSYNMIITENPDPAVDRLNRVTALFGRRYVNHAQM